MLLVSIPVRAVDGGRDEATLHQGLRKRIKVCILAGLLSLQTARCHTYPTKDISRKVLLASVFFSSLGG